MPARKPRCTHNWPGSAVPRFNASTCSGFSLDAKLVRELATCRWVGNGDALLLLEPPGVGKTHLAAGLGREAIQHGYSTLFTSATALVTR